MEWQLQDAKNRFSEVVATACARGPQTVKRRGKATVVILSIKDYRKLLHKKNSLVDFFKHSPLKGAGLDLERSREQSRKVKL